MSFERQSWLWRITVSLWMIFTTWGIIELHKDVRAIRAAVESAKEQK